MTTPDQAKQAFTKQALTNLKGLNREYAFDILVAGGYTIKAAEQVLAAVPKTT